MKSLNKCKRIEVLQSDGTWLQAYMDQLEYGDIIRSFEADGTPVMAMDGSGEPLRATVHHVDVIARTYVTKEYADSLRAQERLAHEEELAEQAVAAAQDYEESPPVLIDNRMSIEEQALDIVRQCSEAETSGDVRALKLLITEALEGLEASQELIERVWNYVVEGEAELLADEDGDFGPEGLDDEDVILFTDDPVSDLDDIFIPTTECDKLLKLWFEKGLSNRDITKQLKSAGYTVEKGQIENKRSGYNRWIKTLDS